MKDKDTFGLMLLADKKFYQHNYASHSCPCTDPRYDGVVPSFIGAVEHDSVVGKFQSGNSYWKKCIAIYNYQCYVV